MSRSALNLEGMCCSAAPVCLATRMANPASARSSSAACARARGFLATHCRTKAPSARRAACAPPSAAALAATQPSTKPRSPRSCSLALPSAAPLRATASATKPRSPCSAGVASARAPPPCRTASSTRARSARSSSAARPRAAPRLGPRAARTRSRSAWTSGGAEASCAQSLRTIARQQARRKLLRSSAEGPGASPPPGERTPVLSAAWSTEVRTRATPPRPDSSGRALALSFWAANAALRASSSSAGRSFETLKSLMSLSGVLPFISSEALAPARKTRLGMPMENPATRSSKSSSRSTLTNAASHLSAPHSARFSLTSGVRISAGGVFLW
mmetsp:Transcript_22409/g.70307  ORF Transcript_22409/g.70307 Transcript_22409/m.70307 type:complete len:330 (-) Transcript_22409:302-1291(-)